MIIYINPENCVVKQERCVGNGLEPKIWYRKYIEITTLAGVELSKVLTFGDDIDNLSNVFVCFSTNEEKKLIWCGECGSGSLKSIKVYEDDQEDTFNILTQGKITI